MKNKPLRVQISITFIASFMIFILIFCVMNVGILRHYFTNKNYKDIETIQNIVVERIKEGSFDFSVINKEELQDYRAIQHFTLIDGNVGKSRLKNNHQLFKALPDEVVKEIEVIAEKQNDTRAFYTLSHYDKDFYYGIYKFKILNKEVNFISYRIIDTKGLVSASLVYQLILGLLITLFLAFVLSYIIAKYLTKPLVDLEKKVSLIAKKEWDDAIDIKRGDEIGRLGKSIEAMRKDLKENNDSMQSTLQYISHELKTPVMVIRSYVQSIEDGIYPKGDLNSSLAVIDSEADRLDKRIKDLIFFTKMDFLNKQDNSMGIFNLKDLILEVVDRFEVNNKEIKWDINLENINLRGNYDQWKVVIENLLSNQMRYANMEIVIDLKKICSKVILVFGNDGPPIDHDVKDSIFAPFKMGKKGSSGLGLAIVKKVVESHNGKIWVENMNKWVCFKIELN